MQDRLPTDRLLLRQYVMLGSEAAFAEIVQRHERLVYAAALREVGDRQTTEDVTQAVFLILAQRAPGLWNHDALAGWLFQAVRLAEKNALRQEQRRRQREDTAAAHMVAASPSRPPDDALRLNEALSALRPPEREAVLLRFFQDANFAEVGAALGVSEDTAQKRVSRALDKMRVFLTQPNGAALSVVAVAGLLSAEAAGSVPPGCGEAVLHVLPGLKVTLGAGSLLGSRASHIAQGVLRTMKAKSVLKAAAVCAIACACVSTLWAGNGVNRVIAGTWISHATLNFPNFKKVYNLQTTYNPNGTYTQQFLQMTTRKPSAPPIIIFGVETGIYKLMGVRRTSDFTSAYLSRTLIQETINGKPLPFLKPPPDVPTIIISGDRKTMRVIDYVIITRDLNGKIVHKGSRVENVLYRQ